MIRTADKKRKGGHGRRGDGENDGLTVRKANIYTHKEVSGNKSAIRGCARHNRATVLIHV